MSVVKGHSVVAAPGDRLSPRARLYLVIAAFRHGMSALFLICAPQLFDGLAFNGIKESLPLPARYALLGWGVLFMFTALICAAGAITARENPARLALLGSVVSTAIVVAGFIASAIDGSGVAPFGFIFGASLVGKDLTMLQDPLRNPFERYVQRVFASREEG